MPGIHVGIRQFDLTGWMMGREGRRGAERKQLFTHLLCNLMVHVKQLLTDNSKAEKE